MNVSGLSAYKAAFMQKPITVANSANSPDSTKNARTFHSLASHRSEEINNGVLKEIDPEKVAERELRLKLAYKYRTALHGKSMEEIYQNAFEEFENLEKSSDSEKIKAISRDVLELMTELKIKGFVSEEYRASLKIDVFIEKDKKVMREMVSFNSKQVLSIFNSAQKLTLNFLSYIRNNQGKLNYSDALKYANKNSKGKRDINNLSTGELTDYFEFAKSSGYAQNLSYSDKSYYEDFFNTLSDGSVNSFDSIYGGASRRDKMYDAFFLHEFDIYV